MLCTEASCIWLLLPQEGPERNLSGKALPQVEGGSENREVIEAHRRQHVFVHLEHSKAQQHIPSEMRPRLLRPPPRWLRPRQRPLLLLQPLGPASAAPARPLAPPRPPPAAEQTPEAAPRGPPASSPASQPGGVNKCAKCGDPRGHPASSPASLAQCRPAPTTARFPVHCSVFPLISPPYCPHSTYLRGQLNVLCLKFAEVALHLGALLHGHNT